MGGKISWCFFELGGCDQTGRQNCCLYKKKKRQFRKRSLRRCNICIYVHVYNIASTCLWFLFNSWELTKLIYGSRFVPLFWWGKTHVGFVSINGEWCLLFFVAILVEPKSSGFNALIRNLICMSCKFGSKSSIIWVLLQVLRCRCCEAGLVDSSKHWPALTFHQFWDWSLITLLFPTISFERSSTLFHIVSRMVW